LSKLSPLPVDAALPDLIAALREHGSAVLHAPTGSGKTTRVPPALLDSGLVGDKRIVMLEPRRIAARAAAKRIASERGSTLGGEIGFQVRFQRVASQATRVLVVTEGLLLRMLQADPFLEDVGVVIFDEFHERNVHSDVALALCKSLQSDARPDLKLVVMSATLDSDRLAHWLNAPVVRSEGRTFPVDIQWLDRPSDRTIEEQAAAAVRTALAASTGHMLVFMPGMREIRQTIGLLSQIASEHRVLALHGSMSPDEQDEIFREDGRRKIVVATNVAETSITIPGVSVVIDSGLARMARYDAASGLDRIDTQRISVASTDQRAGRAGRDGPGRCIRLWTSAAQLQLQPQEVAEIRRMDLSPIVLQLLEWGVTDPALFDWFERPEPLALLRAFETLEALGCVRQGGITPEGRLLAAFPLHPRLAKLAAHAHRLGHTEAGATAAALLSERDPIRNETLRHNAGNAHRSHSDVWDRYTALQGRSTRFRRDDIARQDAARIRDDAEQTVRTCREVLGKSPVATFTEEEAVLRSVAAAWFDRMAVMRESDPGRAVMRGGKGVRAADASAVRDEKFLVVVEFETGRQERSADAFWRQASVVEREWLDETQFDQAIEYRWDSSRNRVMAMECQRIAGVAVKERPVAIADMAAASRVLAEQAAMNPTVALGFDDERVIARLQRLRFAATHMPSEGFPDPDHLHAQLPALCVGSRSFDELRSSRPIDALWDMMTHAQRRLLDAEAPEKIEVPSGSQIALDYSDPSAPVMAVRIQEVFGMLDTPRLARGALPVTMHLLAPNFRPQQVTRDLRSFWAGAYHDVRKELRLKYPRHAWPDDPFTAKAERGPRRRNS
jgi:ATP-dependent helicase HrpB